tara:strand:+ start:126 stop:1625 length:1500 start_codon:yes stop_codon:yes gene_type:complete
MVDILAKQRPHTQTELDSKLTPIGQKLRESSLISKPGIVKDYMLTELPLIQDERIAVKTKAQSQTQASAKEGLVERPESNDVAEIENVSTVQEGEVKPSLVDRPVMYAAEGLNDVEVDRPIVVGEKEREVIFPSKNGISIVPVSSLVNNPNERSDVPIIENFITDKFKDTDGKFKEFADRVGFIESDNGKNIYNKDSSASGVYQFKTADGEEDGTGSSFRTAINHYKDLYNAITKSPSLPRWLNQAIEHNDPRKLTEAQQKELFFANLYNRPGTDKYFEAIARGDNQAGLDLYAEKHHTNVKVKDNARIRKAFGLSAVQKSAIETDPASVQQAGFLFRNPTTSDKQSETEQLLNYIFPKEEAKEVKEVKNDNGRAMPSGPPSKKTDQEPEGFDFNKLTYGKKGMIDINYFYDNLDAIATHGFKQRFGQDLDPNAKQLKDARDEAMAKLSAYIAIKIDKVDGKILDTKREEYIKPDPYDPLGKRKQELFDEYGPKILPEA